MLFAEDPQRFIGQAEGACVRFKGTDVVSYIDRRDLHGPLYQLVDDAEQFIYRHFCDRDTRRQGEREKR